MSEPVPADPPSEEETESDDKATRQEWGGLRPQKVKEEKHKGWKVGQKVGQHGTYLGERGTYDDRNQLKDLTGR